jgi:hypothetical protein
MPEQLPTADSDQSSAPQDQPTARLDRPTRTVAIALLVIFLGAIAFMFLLRGDSNWDRMVYVFSGLEAIVFAAAGALFGTTVQRSSVAAARASAEQARDEASAAQADARAAMGDAAKGQALASAVKAFESDSPTDSGGGVPSGVRQGARSQPSTVPSSPGDPAMRALSRLAGELFPE